MAVVFVFAEGGVTVVLIKEVHFLREKAVNGDMFVRDLLREFIFVDALYCWCCRY